MVRSFFTCAVGLAVLSLVGCPSGSGPKTVPVSGMVSLDDKPLEGVEINFYYQPEDFLATGVTDADGRYDLYTGAVAGENTVWIVKRTVNDTDPAGGDPAENPEADPAQMTAMVDENTEPGEEVADADQLAKKFSDPEETVLKFVVPSGGTSSADFRLTSE